MICPKCGFDQPDDAYCAFCGINIRKYRHERRKKQNVMYVLVSLAVIAGVFIAFSSFRQAETPESVVQYAEKTGEHQVKDVELPATGRELFEAKREPRTWKSIDRQRRSTSKRKASFRPERLEDGSPGAAELSRNRPLAEPTPESVPEAPRGEELTASEWFEKGRALDDESESEVEFYEKALELNPEFAPAYYQLGAIHFRHARYEPADRAFAKFIEHASEAERQAYDIYVYYSPSDMERLTAAAVTEEVSGEEEKKEASAEAPGAVSTEAEVEGKETPSEVEEVLETASEEGQAETTAETEGSEKETPEEAEETEAGVSAEVPKEAEEETEY
jgi:tetratricopeptide (TPR) repeat protein